MIPDEGTVDPATALCALIDWADRTDDPGVRRVLLRLAVGSALTLVSELINPEVD